MTVWRVGDERTIDLSSPVIMGVLNVTPDSFSDGGRFEGVDRAVARGSELAAAGAAIIDVGGESTRPRAARVSDDEQIARAIPVIERLAREVPEIVISIDTTRVRVAQTGLDAGATVINDVSGGAEEPAILTLASERRCGLVLMHRLTSSDSDVYSDQYGPGGEPDYGGDVVEAVRRALARCVRDAEAAGVSAQSIVVDPGLGFGKTVRQNFDLIAGVGAIVADGPPVLCGASRKSFLGAASGQEEPARRLHESTTAAAWMWHQGVRLFRVHDVAAHRAALAVAEAIGQS